MKIIFKHACDIFSENVRCVPLWRIDIWKNEVSCALWASEERFLHSK
jgi:hypothetical protein